MEGKKLYVRFPRRYAYNDVVKMYRWWPASCFINWSAGALNKNPNEYEKKNRFFASRLSKNVALNIWKLFENASGKPRFNTKSSDWNIKWYFLNVNGPCVRVPQYYPRVSPENQTEAGELLWDVLKKIRVLISRFSGASGLKNYNRKNKPKYGSRGPIRDLFVMDRACLCRNRIAGIHKCSRWFIIIIIIIRFFFSLPPKQWCNPNEKKNRNRK